ncbi:hypothetical protein P879_08583 [Paragonimus westermani]|uniref:Beta-1,3-galactosyl-O-glycosyl-glycoprotein beta-1,6-N-acetylglucosaminyltransferase n=1 Tax=Paragonimus westermani TaxID=34504 RepID=A0A8T0DCJ1_9TREM|nr:hypothetical protein P879_08583 [Paragonimus westermani]
MRKWQCAFVCAALTAVVLLSMTGKLTRSVYHNEGPALYRSSRDCQQAISDKSPLQLTYEWYAHALHEQHTNYECEQLRTPNGESVWTSEEEQRFPIAYAIAAYESFTRLARLLRMIHRNHNVYCIHVDAKAPKDFVRKVKYLAQCFGSNVILVADEQRVDVRWGYFSVLQSTLICSELLLKNELVDWRYMLNINEKEFPLRTNWELVSSLKALNGSNMVEGIPGDKFSDRFPNSNFSFKFSWVKGSFLVALRREFVQFIHTDKRALEILSAMKAESHIRKVQDELFFSTLAYNPHLGAPGACSKLHPITYQDPRSWFLARYVNWDEKHCPSKLAVHWLCILGMRDLPILVRQPHLFANKFLPHFEPEAYTCMEYWYWKKVHNERIRRVLDPSFNKSLYSQLYCTQEHI